MYTFRGGVKIENRENLGQNPNRGGGKKKTQKCPNFNLGHLKTEGGGGHYFSKMSQLEKALRNKKNKLTFAKLSLNFNFNFS